MSNEKEFLINRSSFDYRLMFVYKKVEVDIRADTINI